MKTNIQESLRKIIRQEIKSILNENVVTPIKDKVYMVRLTSGDTGTVVKARYIGKQKRGAAQVYIFDKNLDSSKETLIKDLIYVPTIRATTDNIKIIESVNEGPEELGAYRRLVITSPASKEIKDEFTKFMSRPEIKTQYPGITMKIVDSPKPETIVVDVNGDKATVIGIKLGDIVKRVDSAAKVIVRKERKLK